VGWTSNNLRGERVQESGGTLHIRRIEPHQVFFCHPLSFCSTATELVCPAIQIRLFSVGDAGPLELQKENRCLFERFDSDDKFLIYGSLLNSVRTNSGQGFINSDQGHLAYRTGAKGNNPNLGTLGDQPNHNRLYKMMLELSRALKDHPEL
jgi:hypothetical protein